MDIEVLRLPHAAGLPLPSYQTALAAGMDLVAAIAADTPLTLAAGERALVPTGIALAIPAGVEGQIRPRSGLALTHGITVLNAPGTIDADYRGELQVILVNFGAKPFVVTRGSRIAQLVFTHAVRAAMREVTTLSETPRGVAGFGSTGTGRERPAD